MAGVEPFRFAPRKILAANSNWGSLRWTPATHGYSAYRFVAPDFQDVVERLQLAVWSNGGGRTHGMNWLKLFVLMLLTVGPTELMVTLINRLESLPIPRRVLKAFRALEDALIIAF